MSSRLNPYLSFRDNAKEAMEFYKSVFGGELTMSTFKEFQAAQDPSDEDKIMHSQLESGALVFMGADTPSSMEFQESSRVSMSLSGDNDDEGVLKGYFDKLAEGGKVTMPLEKAQWGDTFGMLNDKFGITWLVNIAAKK
jgi:PhnB protein